jgi:hypothetical protein
MTSFRRIFTPVDVNFDSTSFGHLAFFAWERVAASIPPPTRVGERPPRSFHGPHISDETPRRFAPFEIRHFHL